MIHILLTILKIFGILLLILLGVLLLLLLTVLFVPIRYKAKGQKIEDDISGHAKVSWLLGLISFVVVYQEKKIDYKLGILGYNLLKLQKKRKKSVSCANNADKTKEKEDTKGVKESPASIASEKLIQSVSDEKTKAMKSTETKTLAETKASAEPVEKKSNVFSKVIERMKKIKLTIKNIYGKIDYWKRFLTDKRTREALRLVKDHVVKLIKHILPKKIKGQIVYGFDDPCKTGQLLAGVSVVYPIYHKHFIITPDFNHVVLDGNVDMKGRIYLFYVLKSVLTIIFNKNIQYIIHTFRNKEAS